MSKRLAKKVLVIGWDAADWKIINPLMDAGQMPTLEKLVNRGAMGKIATLDPPLSPVLWTSIASGKTADKHGILNFVEPDPDTGDIRPVSVTSRKVKAIWNILTQQGYKTHLVGWWPSHPAEPINGICVSNMYHKIPKEKQEEWTLPKGTVYPEELHEILNSYRIDPYEITGQILLPFVPNAAKIDQEKDKSLQAIANGICEAVNIQSAATWIMENHSDWDFMGVYFDAIDHFCHGFMKYHPPRQEGIPEEYYELYKDVINSIYRLQDMMLERMLQLAGDDATVILLSDHGFHSDHLRPKKLPKEPIAPALEHSPYGIICMAGPGIIKDERIFGATLLDITPTILSLFGLPIGKDMDGKPLLQAFSEKITPEYIPSWDEVAGECGMHPKDVQQDPWAAQEAMAQLVELGYVDAPGEDKTARIKIVKDETGFILAKVYASTKRYPEAIELLERLFSENPEATRYGVKLAQCYQLTRRIPEFRHVIETLESRKLSNMPHLDYLHGILYLFENKPRKALASLQKAETEINHIPNLHLQIGNVYLKLKKWSDAERAFNRAIAMDVNNAHAYHGLAVSLLRQGKYENAAEEALNAITLIHYFPEAHYHLGEALYALKIYERAAQAFEVAIAMNPGYRKAHQRLVKIYEEHLQLKERAAQSKKFIQEQIRGTIVLISGFSTEGFDRLEKMLATAGIPVEERAFGFDESGNTKISENFDNLSALAKDMSWLSQSQGKAVKINTALLSFLPEQYNYQLLFIEQELVRIAEKYPQYKSGKRTSFHSGLLEKMKKQEEKVKGFLKAQPNFDCMYLPLDEIPANSEEIAENITAFLNLEGSPAELANLLK